MPTDESIPPNSVKPKSPTDGDTKSIPARQTTNGQDTDFSADFDQEAPKTVGKYEIRSQLGKGGMGAVYLGFDPLIEREVAIKVLHAPLQESDTSLQRFLAEARAVGKLNHPNAIAIYEIGETDGDYFIVMELAEGGNVRELLREQSSLSVSEACRITIEAARGLEAAHRLGLIHRDIKPENLMLTTDGVVKIVDFGLARQIDRAKELSLTQTGQLLGTPFYMSPEQIKSNELDARTDVYSLGATFYQMLTGQTPFNGDSLPQVVYAHLKADRPDPAQLKPGLPEMCADIVSKAMAVDPDERYGSMHEMIRDIERLASTVTDDDSEMREIAGSGEDAASVNLAGIVPRVMIVESSKLAAKVLNDVFHLAGCDDVRCVESAGEALGQSSKLPPDVVVTARTLPDASGESMYEQMQPALTTREPVCVLLSSDDPVDLLTTTDPVGTTVFARKQSPDQVTRAIDSCSDYALAGIPAATRDRAIRVAVISDDGTIDEDLAEWLQDWGITPVVHPTSEIDTLASEGESPELILWISSIVESPESRIERLRGPLRPLVKDAGAALALLGTTATGPRLHAYQRSAFVVTCDKSFDRGRLARMLRHF